MKPNNSDDKLFTDKPNLKFTAKLKQHLIKEEIFLMVLSVTAYFLKIEMLLIIGMLALSLIYFFMYFAEYKTDKKEYKIMITVFLFLSNWGKAAAITGILFSTINHQGGEILLELGFGALIFSLLILSFYLTKKLKDEIFSYTELIRNLIISGVSILFLFNIISNV